MEAVLAAVRAFMGHGHRLEMVRVLPAAAPTGRHPVLAQSLEALAHHDLERRSARLLDGLAGRRRVRDLQGLLEVRLHLDEVEHKLLAGRAARYRRGPPVGDDQLRRGFLGPEHAPVEVLPEPMVPAESAGASNTGEMTLKTVHASRKQIRALDADRHGVRRPGSADTL